MDLASIAVVIVIFGFVFYTIREPIRTAYQWLYEMYQKNKPVPQQTIYESPYYMFGGGAEEQ